MDKILESHAHADHLTSARYLQLKLGKGEGRSVETGIGEKIRQTQEYFAKKYELRSEELEGAFDKLWKDEEKFTVGECVCEVMHLPGHTVSSPCSRERFVLGGARTRLTILVRILGRSRRVQVRFVLLRRRFNLPGTHLSARIV